MTVWLAVQCIHCHSTNVVKNGKSLAGKQRYRCQNNECPCSTFILKYSYPGRSREVKQKIVDMSLNGSGVRDISRVLHVSTATVIQELKKRSSTKSSKSEAERKAKPRADRSRLNQSR